jgi:hypothetical protein
MDPNHYQNLGVPRDCTREELKDAFRARSWIAHPDRGGDPATFVRLCEAYKAILTELDEFPRAESPKAARPQRRRRASYPRPPDPNWEPELLLGDAPFLRDRAARPPDPNWVPELVILDESAGSVCQGTSDDSATIRRGDATWLREFWARNTQKAPSEQSTRIATIVLITLIGAIALGGFLCWLVWTSVADGP